MRKEHDNQRGIIFGIAFNIFMSPHAGLIRRRKTIRIKTPDKPTCPRWCLAENIAVIAKFG